MALKVSIVGVAPAHRAPNPAESLVFRALELVSGSRVELSRVSEAELVLLYPYCFPFNSTVNGAVIESALKRIPFSQGGNRAETLLRKICRIPARVPLLAISHENLDRRPWQMFGNLLLQTNLPRLTFWPQDLDPKGFRFPYWWNYVDWPEIPRADRGTATRFGAFYDLDVLCESQDLNKDKQTRQDKAVWLTNHLEFPRGAILDKVKEILVVDVVKGVPWGQKYELLQNYRYCITTENSTGYGYETEKNPEARMAGCIPVGYIQNSFSDFAAGSFFYTPPAAQLEKIPPLLKSRPNLEGLFAYLGDLLNMCVVTPEK